MTTAKIYRVKTDKAYYAMDCGWSWSLEPGKCSEYQEQWDDGGRDYELPEGYEVVDNYGQPFIYGPDGFPCEIYTHGKSPMIYGPDGQHILKLAR